MHRRTRRPAVAALAALAALVATAACGSDPASGPEPDPPVVPIHVPAQGSAATLDLGSWNVEWFGHGGNGPSDDATQLRNVREVVGDADLDVWALEEVVDETRFAQLLDSLPGYAGILANDPAVEGGPAAYNGFGGTEQKVALLYRTDVATVHGARVILADHDYDFAGRPPVEFRMTATVAGASEEIVVVVLHAKAGSDAASRDRRAAASAALESYLDATWPTQKVVVLGDFNDDVDASITAGAPSPYANFVDAPARYAFPTRALSDAGISASVSYPDLIDHHLASDEMMAVYVAGSARVLEADEYVPDYAATTSDHFPVITRYDLSADGAP